MQPISNKNNTTRLRGLVISYFGSSVAVEAPSGQVVQCLLHRNQELPVVGDQVIWQMENAETGVVLEVEPRRTLLSRGDGRGKMKPLAANVDAILVVMAPPPIFSEHLVDRYLVAAELVGIEPILVLNKTDLLDKEALAAAKARLEPYLEMNYQVILGSALSEDGVHGIEQALKDKSAVFVGPSGVGKSSIISRLTHEDIQTTNVSKKGAGKHTTTATRLYHLPDGGSLIDSPGVREFSLWPVSVEELLKGFRDIKAHLGHCRFRDCSHLVEPDCMVQVALAAGKISAVRFDSFKELRKSCK